VFALPTAGFTASLFQPARYDDDFSFLRDPATRSDSFEELKYLSLGQTAWLSLGGESRTRYEYLDHTLWGQGPQDENGFWTQRSMLHADFHGDEGLRAFVQLKSGLEQGRTGGPRPTDEDRLDLNQVFVDFPVHLTASASLTIRIGRQEIAFGSSRIISYRDGPNVRQSFDGVRAILTAGNWRTDFFGVSPAKTNVGTFDDATDSSQELWGAYAVGPLAGLAGMHADLYYLGLKKNDARYDQGHGREERHSFGTRIWGRRGEWDFNFEGLYQFGTFSRGSIAAWTLASDTGVTFADVPGKPRFALKADIASGDRNPLDGKLQTFNALFPRGGYFNDSAIIGPANFVDFHPSVEIHPVELLTVSFDCDFYWRESRRDGIYGSSLNLIRSGQSANSLTIGSQPSMRTEWKPSPRWTVVATAAYFVAGKFLQQTGPSENIRYFTSWVTYLF
jgi:hypothetical protein